MPRLTTLFADISDSTALFERHGNQQTRDVFQRLLADLGQIASQHGGKLIKTIGDEALCLFPNAASGLDAAVTMQKHVADRYFLGADALAIRIGLFHGDVIIEPDDIFGDGVNVAARLVALANAGQILADESTVASVSSAAAMPTFGYRPLGAVAVKGKQQPLQVMDVLWEDSNTQLTSLARVLDGDALRRGELLHLRMAAREWPVCPADTPFTLGRDPQCQLVMTSATVSRRHAVIEYRGGQFVFTDKSSNGSWLRLGGELVRVHRSSAVLFGQGEVHCGSVYDATDATGGAPHLIHFLLGNS